MLLVKIFKKFYGEIIFHILKNILRGIIAQITPSGQGLANSMLYFKTQIPETNVNARHFKLSKQVTEQ